MSIQHSAPSTSTSSLPPRCHERYVALPTSILQNDRIPPPAKVLAAKLAQHGWRTGYITWTLPYLARCCDMAPRTLSKWLRNLDVAGCVESVPDLSAPSGRRLVLTWLTPPDAEPISDRTSVQLHVPAPHIVTRGRGVKPNPEKEEGPERPRPEPETAQEAHLDVPEHREVQPVQEIAQALPEPPGTSPKVEKLRAERMALEEAAATDPILARAMAKTPAEPPRPEPETLEDLVYEVRESVRHVPALARALQVDLKDHPNSFRYWLIVAQAVANRMVDPAVIVRIYRYAMGPEVPDHKKAPYFSHSLKLE